MALLVGGAAFPAAAGGGLSDDAVLTIRGGGWGHGHGLSQYGAQGMAKAGFTWKQILNHYYTGVSIEQRANVEMRVLLSASRTVVVGGPEAYTVRFGDGTLIRRRSDAYPFTRAVADDDGLLVAKGASADGPWSRVASADGGRVLFTADEGPAVPVWRSGRHGYFRGTIEANRRSASTMYGINILSLDEYLYGVVPREMPASWHAQALRAQAVAARSYAMWKRKSAGGADAIYHICVTTFCQSYRGYGVREPGGSLQVLEHDRTTDAIDRTSGRVMIAAGEGPIFAEYHSTSGGATGQGSRSYLAPVDDPYDDLSPYHRWQTTVKASAFTNRWSVGALTGFSYDRNGVGPFGGRVLTMDIEGTTGSVRITGETLRSALGLRSTLLTIDLPEPEVSFADASTHLGGNVVENGSFEASDGGEASGWRAIRGGDALVSTSVDGDEGLRLSGDPDRGILLRQRVRVSGLRGDTFTLSAWNRADDTTSSGGAIDITVRFNHRDGTSKTERLRFPKRAHPWTYRDAVVASGKRYDSIDVTASLRRQTGTTTFDRIRLRRQDLANGGFEAGLSGWDLVNAGGGSGVVTGARYDGDAALRLDGRPDRLVVAKQLRVPVLARAGDVLRLSGWSRTVATDPAGGPVQVRARLTHEDGSRTNHVLRFPRAEHDWVYGEMLIDVASKITRADVLVRTAKQTGAAWFDDVVLAPAQGRALAANAGFELGRPTPGIWTMHNTGDAGAAAATDLSQRGSASLHLAGASGRDRYARQMLPLGGDAGDRYELSGWNAALASNPAGGRIQIWARVRYLDGSVSKHRINFDRSPHDWVERSRTFTTTGAYAGVDVFARYSDQTGDAYFDDVVLQRLA